MSTLFMPFEKAIRKTIKEGDKISPYGLYPESKKEVIISPAETGYNENQIFTREEGLDFWFAISKYGTPTFYGDTTTTRLHLVEKAIGEENAIKAINKACIPFSNLKLGLKGRSMTAEGYDYFRGNKDINKILREMRSYAWLPVLEAGEANNLVLSVGDRYFFYMHFFLLEDYVGRYNNGGCPTVSLKNPDDCLKVFSNGIRPAVSVRLASKILVDLKESEKQGVWILIPKDKQITE